MQTHTTEQLASTIICLNCGHTEGAHYIDPPDCDWCPPGKQGNGGSFTAPKDPARIFKYDLKLDHRQLIHMPPGRILHVAVQQEIPRIWVMHPNPQAKVETRIIRFITTGEEFNEAGLVYIGTFEAKGWFIGHVFEQIGNQPDPVSSRYADDFVQIAKEAFNGTN